MQKGLSDHNLMGLGHEPREVAQGTEPLEGVDIGAQALEILNGQFAVLQESSIIRSPVRGGVLVHPVLFGVGHTLAPRHLAGRSGPVK